MSEERALSDIVWTPERGLSTPEPELRSILWNNFLTNDEPYFGKTRTAAEVRITPESALQSTVVLACCRILAETIAALPIHVMRRTQNGGKEVASDLPLYKVLSFAPNEWQTKFEFFEQIVMFLTLWGNSYSLIRSGKYGAVSALDNLHPSRMEVERLENGRLRYSYTSPETGRLERYTQDQIMHVRWTPEPDGIKGMVPVEVGREAIALARACEIHASKYWANSARPGVVLQTDGSLSPEAAERLRDNWERLHRGVDRAFRTAVLTNGLKAEPLGFSQEQSQFIDSRRFQSEEIARIYRLPLSLVQGQTSGNPEIAGQEFVTYTLLPWLRRIESAISRSLIYNDDVFFAEFDTKGLMRGDSNSRAGFYSTMTNLGIYSINDCRRAEGLAPIENGDKHFVGMNMQTIDDAVKPKPDPMMAAMMGGGAPPPAAGGVPSLPGVKTGTPPRESEQGSKSEKKPVPAGAIKEGDLVTWGDGKVGEVQHVMDHGTLDLKSGEKIEVQDGQPVALVTDPSGEEFGVMVAELKKATEKRSEDCGRQDGGRFGQGNDCAKETGSGEPAKKAAKYFPKDISAGDPSLKNYVPFRPVQGTKNSDFAKPADDASLKAAVAAAKGARLAERYGAPRDLPKGSPVAIRIDVPTFNKSGAYAVTVHRATKSGFDPSPVGYDSVARLDGPVTFESKEDDAVLVASGLSQKFPLATVKGSLSKDRSIPEDIDDWTSVGYDPQKAAYFYDKRTGNEVIGGVDSISVGNSVFVRVPKYPKNPRNAARQYRSAGFWGLESRDNDCGRQDGGRFGVGNDCAKEDGSGSGDSEPKPSGSPKPEASSRTFPSGTQQYRDAVDRVVASIGKDPKAVWDRSKGKADTPPRQTIETFAQEQNSQSGKPLTPEAEAAYSSLVDEIGRQYEALVESGLRVSAWRGEGEPYGDPPGSTKPSSDKMREQVAETGEFKFFMTERGFGTGAATENHPMLRETKFKTSDGEPMIANDLFRVVHDLVAHVRGGYSFSTNGEYNGMLTHASTLPEEAWPALFAETFGQNAVYELTGDFAAQNAYASRAGADVIRKELAKRKGQSRAEDTSADPDEPLGYQHLKVRPWLAKEISEKRAFCPTGDGGGVDNSCSSTGIKSGQVTEAALKSIRETGGFSVHPVAANSPTTGYMVSVVPESETILNSADDVTEEAITTFFEQNKSHFDERPTLHLGGWVDQATGKVYLDLSEKFDSVDDAIDSAESTNQLAIWDLNEKKEIRKDDYDGRRTRAKKEPRSLRLPSGDVSEANRRGPARRSKADHGGEREADGLISSASSHFSSLPKIEVRSIGPLLASYSSEEDAIYVSPDATMLERDGWTSQPNPVLHELAHRTHAKSDPASYEASLSREFTPEQRSLIEAEVSRYAAVNGREFVAEVIAGVLSGHDYSGDIMQMFYEITDDKVAL